MTPTNPAAPGEKGARTPEDVLRAAAAYMREHGRYRCDEESTGVGPGDSCCPAVAITRVGGSPTAHALLRARLGSREFTAIEMWNAATADDAEIFRVMENPTAAPRTEEERG